MSKGGSGLFQRTIGQLASLAEDVLVVITPQGDRMIDFDSLPGTKGIRVPKRLSDKQMEYLTKQYGVEFAQVYELGKGKNGRGGTYRVYSGNTNSVVIPVSSKIILINHTHPGGTAYPSDKDRKLMGMLSAAGSPQITSEIVPAGRKSVKFTKKGLK